MVAGGGDQRRGSGEAAPDETAFEEAPTDARQESSNARKQRIVGALSLAGLGLLIVAWVRSTIDGPASLALKMASIELKKEISWHPPESAAVHNTKKTFGPSYSLVYSTCNSTCSR